MKYILLFLVVSLQGFAQQTVLQKPMMMSKLDYSLAGLTIAGRAADWTSTEECIRRPANVCHETLLPKSLVQNKVGFALYEAGSVGTLFYFQYVLIKTGHVKIARIVAASNISLDGVVSAHNYRLASR